MQQRLIGKHALRHVFTGKITRCEPLGRAHPLEMDFENDMKTRRELDISCDEIAVLINLNARAQRRTVPSKPCSHQFEY